MFIPGKRADKAIAIKTYVVNIQIPLLLSKDSMIYAGIKIDFLGNKAEIFNKNISLHLVLIMQFC